jgi:hypothetical protein
MEKLVKVGDKEAKGLSKCLSVSRSSREYDECRTAPVKKMIKIYCDLSLLYSQTRMFVCNVDESSVLTGTNM